MSLPSVRPASIFIVEDDPDFRETFIDAMSLRGVEVCGAGSAAEALRRLERLRPDVLVLDVQLPDVHGFELCRRIKRLEAFKRTPVVFVSASTQYSDARDRVEGLLAGASLFLAKPISLETLWLELQALLS